MSYKTKKFSHIKPDFKEKEQEIGNYIISTLGYQATAEKIKAMTLAGVNLALIRSENYQGEAGEDMPIEMTTRRDLDLVDAHKALQAKTAELKRYRARLDAEQKKRLEERQNYLEETAKKYEEMAKRREMKMSAEPPIE